MIVLVLYYLIKSNFIIMKFLQIFYFQDTLLAFTYKEIISTRSFSDQKSTAYVDFRCGNLVSQRSIRLETPRVWDSFSRCFFIIISRYSGCLIARNPRAVIIKGTVQETSTIFFSVNFDDKVISNRKWGFLKFSFFLQILKSFF